jgi:hypothetical protein
VATAHWQRIPLGLHVARTKPDTRPKIRTASGLFPRSCLTVRAGLSPSWNSGRWARTTPTRRSDIVKMPDPRIERFDTVRSMRCAHASHALPTFFSLPHPTGIGPLTCGTNGCSVLRGQGRTLVRSSGGVVSTAEAKLSLLLFLHDQFSLCTMGLLRPAEVAQTYQPYGSLSLVGCKTW